MNWRAVLTKGSIFTAISAFLVFGLAAIYWPTVYFTVPALVPFQPYLNTPWAVPVLYFVFIGGMSGFLAGAKSWPRSIVIFIAVCSCSALIVHVTLNMLGYHYYVEAP